jgi:hypothetical protein
VKTCAWGSRAHPIAIALELIGALALSPQVASAQETTVAPEQSVAVVVSNRDVNRIYCPKDVEDVVWSKEKPVTVKVAGGNVFVKFMVARQGEGETRVTAPLDVHIVCEGEVYTLILHPREMDSVTVRLVDSTRKALAAVAKDWGSLPLEERVKRLTLIAYHNETPAGFVRRTIEANDPRANIKAYRDLQILGTIDTIAPGTGLRATEYTVIAAKPMTLSERDFLLKDMGEIVAVTVDPLHVAAQGASRVIIISGSTADEP